MGCFSDPIDLDLNKSNPKLSITAWITDSDSEQYVVVARSSEYIGANTINYVNDATVYLRNSQDEYELQKNADSGPYFLPADWTPRIDEVYELEVIVDGKSYMSADTMRACPEILMPSFVDNTQSGDSIPMFLTEFSFTEPAGGGDGYYLLDYKKNETIENFIDRGTALTDEYIDGQLLEKVTVTDGDHRFVKGDTAVIEMYSIGKSAVQYIEQVNSEAFKGESPFEPIPVNVKTNISNGAIGYFMIGSVRSAEVIIN